MKTKILIIVFAKAMLGFGNVSHAQDVKPSAAENKTNVVRVKSGDNAMASDSTRGILPASFDFMTYDSEELHNKMTEQLMLFIENMKDNENQCVETSGNCKLDTDMPIPEIVY